MEDLSTIMKIMHHALELVEDKSWYAVDGEEFVGKCIEGQGFTLKALVDGNIAGFLTVRYPWKEDDNLGDYIGLSEEEKMFVLFFIFLISIFQILTGVFLYYRMSRKRDSFLRSDG